MLQPGSDALSSPDEAVFPQACRSVSACSSFRTSQ